MTRHSQPKGESSWRLECGIGQRRSRKTVEAIGRCSGPGARVMVAGLGVTSSSVRWTNEER